MLGDSAKNSANGEPNEPDNGAIQHYHLQLNKYQSFQQKPHNAHRDTIIDHKHQRHHCNTILLWMLCLPFLECPVLCVLQPP